MSEGINAVMLGVLRGDLVSMDENADIKDWVSLEGMDPAIEYLIENREALDVDGDWRITQDEYFAMPYHRAYLDASEFERRERFSLLERQVELLGKEIDVRWDNSYTPGLPSMVGCQEFLDLLANPFFEDASNNLSGFFFCRGDELSFAVGELLERFSEETNLAAAKLIGYVGEEYAEGHVRTLIDGGKLNRFKAGVEAIRYAPIGDRLALIKYAMDRIPLETKPVRTEAVLMLVFEQLRYVEESEAYAFAEEFLKPIGNFSPDFYQMKVALLKVAKDVFGYHNVGSLLFVALRNPNVDVCKAALDQVKYFKNPASLNYKSLVIERGLRHRDVEVVKHAYDTLGRRGLFPLDEAVSDVDLMRAKFYMYEHFEYVVTHPNVDVKKHMSRNLEATKGLPACNLVDLVMTGVLDEKVGWNFANANYLSRLRGDYLKEFLDGILEYPYEDPYGGRSLQESMQMAIRGESVPVEEMQDYRHELIAELIPKLEQSERLKYVDRALAHSSKYVREATVKMLVDDRFKKFRAYHVEKRFTEILKNDPSTEVRLAVVNGIDTFYNARKQRINKALVAAAVDNTHLDVVTAAKMLDL